MNTTEIKKGTTSISGIPITLTVTLFANPKEDDRFTA